jgi:hypothetical protein
MSVGFSPGNWAELKSALLNHPQNNPVTNQAGNPFGQKFEVRCSLITPDGRNPCPTSIRGSSRRIQTLDRASASGR